MSLADELQKLQTLREEGALTDEEFALAKKRLLDVDSADARAEAATAAATEARADAAAAEARADAAIAQAKLERANADAKRNAGRPDDAQSVLNRFRRSLTDRWIGGVCGGLAELSGAPSWTWRILFVLTAFLHGVGIIMYLILWIFVPVQTAATPPVIVPPPRAQG